MWRVFIPSIVIAFVITHAPRAGAQDVEWSGRGHYRVLLEVDPVAIDGRPADELALQLGHDFGYVTT